MTKEKHLYRTLFLVSVFLLLINDLYLKYEFHNYWTGKISDFAGLFAFPYFLSCFFPKKVKPIYIITGILFVIWKSSFSQPIFELVHSFGLGIDRTVDYSDLISISILPISYYYWKSSLIKKMKSNKIFKPIIVGVCCFAFVATSLPRKSNNYNFKSDYRIEIKTDFENAKNKMSFYKSTQNERYIYHIEIPQRKADIKTKISINELENGHLEIQLDSILNYSIEGTGLIFYSDFDKEDLKYIQNLNKTEIEKLFSEQIKKQLNKK